MYRTKSDGVRGGGMLSDGNGELIATGHAAAGGGIPPAVQYAVFASGGAIVLLAVIFGLVMCRRGNRALSAAAAALNNDDDRNKPYLKGEKNAASSSLLRDKLINPPPPDLWINHDQLELRSMDSNQGDGDACVRAPSLPRSTPVDHRGSTSTLDRSRYITPYSGKLSTHVEKGEFPDIPIYIFCVLPFTRVSCYCTYFRTQQVFPYFLLFLYGLLFFA
jgi:hypothetical protein